MSASELTQAAGLRFTANPAELAEAGRQLKAVNTKLEPLEERWLELNEQIEAVAAE